MNLAELYNYHLKKFCFVKKRFLNARWKYDRTFYATVIIKHPCSSTYMATQMHDGGTAPVCRSLPFTSQEK